MDINNLKKLPREELLKIAAQYNVPVHHKAGVDKIVRAIGEAVANQAKPKVDETKPVVKPVVIQSEDDVREAIAPFIAREGYVVNFHGDNTVTFKFKGAEECIHLSSSLNKIKAIATSVSKGARRLTALNEHFDPVNPNAVSQYTKNVLSV